jgi:hypothetical protein
LFTRAVIETPGLFTLLSQITSMCSFTLPAALTALGVVPIIRRRFARTPGNMRH